MQKKLTMTIDEEVYEGLHKNIDPRKISRYIQSIGGKIRKKRPAVIIRNDASNKFLQQDQAL